MFLPTMFLSLPATGPGARNILGQKYELPADLGGRPIFRTACFCPPCFCPSQRRGRGPEIFWGRNMNCQLILGEGLFSERHVFAHHVSVPPSDGAGGQKYFGAEI